MYCSTCNVESGPTLFCHVCDNYLPDPATGLKAGLVRRFVAAVVDNVLAITIFFLSLRWLLSTASVPPGSGTTIIVVSCLAIIAYVIAFFSALSIGMTPGKWMLGVRAVDKRNGRVPGLGRMLVRELIGKFVSEFFLGLGFFWAIWDRDGQAWHDKIAGTVVVRNDAALSQNQPSSYWPFAACFAFFAVLGLQVFSLQDPSRIGISENPSATTPLVQEGQPSYTANTSSDPGTSTTPNTDSSPAVEGSNIATYNDSQPASVADPDQKDTRAQIGAMLSRWAAATAANDPTTGSSFYADTVDRYYLARNLTRDDVRKDIETTLEDGRRFVSFQVEAVNFDSLSHDSANLSLTKSYEIATPGMAPIAREIHSRLWLRNTEDGWKIVGEQDLLK